MFSLVNCIVMLLIFAGLGILASALLISAWTKCAIEKSLQFSAYIFVVAVVAVLVVNLFTGLILLGGIK